MYGMQSLIEDDRNSNSITAKQMVSLFNTFDSAFMCENVCEILRIYHQLFNSKIHMYNNTFLPQRDRPSKRLQILFLIFFMLLVFHRYTSLRY